MTHPILILGAGQAGYSLAREVRYLDPNVPITILTRDDGANYYKPDLSKAFAAGKDAAALVRSDAAAMAAEFKATVRPHTEVTRIDVAGHRVFIGDEAVPYSKLVLAVGASPIRLPIEGNAAGAMLSVNDRQDYARLRDRLTPGCAVLILGAGLIGCEFANDLGAAGYAVTVVDIASWPLARFVPEASGRALQAALGNIGVTWRLGNSVSRLESLPNGRTSAVLAGGERIETDVVLSAVGLRPNIALAQAAGIQCGAGIGVDSFLRTSAEDVYALGDCIELGGRPMPFVLPISHGVRALAPTLTGMPTAAHFPAMPTPVKTPVCPIVVCPPAGTQGEWIVTGVSPDLEAVFVDGDGKPSGFALCGKATVRRGALAAQLPVLVM
jgi:rubredoxin-NAD+ reductase